MANKLMKISSASLVIGEMHTKTKMRYYFSPTRMAIIIKIGNEWVNMVHRASHGVKR